MDKLLSPGTQTAYGRIVCATYADGEVKYLVNNGGAMRTISQAGARTPSMDAMRDLFGDLFKKAGA